MFPSASSLPIIDIAPFLSAYGSISTVSSASNPTSISTSTSTSAPSLPPSSSSATTSASAPSPALRASLTALRAALLTYGFFYITSHGIPSSDLDSVIAHARTFFTEASPAEKRRLQRQNPGTGLGDGARGYQLLGENVTQGRRDWHEAVDWYRSFHGTSGQKRRKADDEAEDAGVTADKLEEDEHGHVQFRNPSTHPDAATASLSTRPPFRLLQGPNLWPSTPPTFRTTYLAHVARMRRVGLAVLHAMGHALELDDPTVFARAAEDSFWVMRAIGYPPLARAPFANGHGNEGNEDGNGNEDGATDEESGVSCGEHSDYGCLTLLLADSTPGALQVRDPAGRWMDVNPLPDCLVVNVGDMVELWTAGWVRSTKHRVVHRSAGFRVSAPFFLEPGKEVVVRPLAECVRRVNDEGQREPMQGEVKYWDHLVGKVSGNFYSDGEEGGEEAKGR